ncbi:MAG: AMP-binding protein [Clostridiales bacterium]|nr:AMP-binding protein [Clostridiales bacterium]
MKCHLLEYFEETVEKKGNLIAVRHNDQEIDFLTLKDKAVKLGHYITSIIGEVTNSPIAVFLPKEINTVIADIGIMYSSNPFMNLDIKTPKERLDNIFGLVKPVVVITSSKYCKILEDISIPVVLIDEIDWSNMDASYDHLLTRRNELIDTDPFCLINTSGSTGTPKCVVLNFRSFFDFITVSNDRFGFDGSEIIGSLSPVVFDIYDFELCMLMVNGSQLVLLDAMLAAFPARLLEKMSEAYVNFIFWVPSIMVNIANMGLLDKISLPDLKLVWFAGEVFPTKQFLVWYDKLPNVLFANLYGPIEITLDCTYFVVEDRPVETEPLPIGIPYRNTEVLILNDENKICEVGEEGELCVRGSSLAMGYYNNPEKTANAFTQNPLNSSYPELIYRTGDIVYKRSDGNIMFKGRKDSLIKHMGYRIELGEIEHVIENDLKIVKYCCAVYQYEKKEIILYYEAEQDITDKEFRMAIGKMFPSYMIPSVYIKMDELPRNTNGKIDRLLLKNKANEV